MALSGGEAKYLSYRPRTLKLDKLKITQETIGEARNLVLDCVVYVLLCGVSTGICKAWVICVGYPLINS